MGEQPGQRAKVEAFTQRLIKAGADPKYAKQKAVAAANKQDRKQNK